MMTEHAHCPYKSWQIIMGGEAGLHKMLIHCFVL